MPWWTVILERGKASLAERREARVWAANENEAIGAALRQEGLREGWHVRGWAPEPPAPTTSNQPPEQGARKEPSDG